MNYLIKLASYYDKIGMYSLSDDILNKFSAKKKEEIDPEILALKDVIDREVRSAKIKLLSVNADPKTIKSFKSGKGFLTGILYLAPYNLSGKNVCPCASEDCIKACLHTAGNPAFMKSKEQGRLNKTNWFFGKSDVKLYDSSDEATRKGFLTRLQREILSLKNIANNHGLQLALRLNGTSDIGWHGVLRSFIEQHPDIKFYDYTKVFVRAMESLTKPNFPVHQTFSRSENNQDQALQILQLGGNVAVVFDKVPETWHGYKVVKGDEDDLRFLDEEHKNSDSTGKKQGLVIGLKAKGDAIKQYRNDKEMGYGPEQRFVVRASEIDGFPFI